MMSRSLIATVRPIERQTDGFAFEQVFFLRRQRRHTTTGLLENFVNHYTNPVEYFAAGLEVMIQNFRDASILIA